MISPGVGSLRCSRFLKLGKYLLPTNSLSRWRNPESPPIHLATLGELAEAQPDVVELYSHGERALNPGEFAFHVFDERQGEVRTAAARSSNTFAAGIRDCSSVGRACCLVAPEQTAVYESGFQFRRQATSGAIGAGLSRFLANYGSCGDLRRRGGLPEKIRVEGRVAAINNRASHNYYHWLIEVAPRIAALDLMGIEVDRILIDCQSRFQADVLGMLNLPDDCVVQPHCRQHVHADQMFYVSDGCAQVLRHFARMLSGAAGVGEPNRKIYISRRKARNRHVVDEHAVERTLIARGFESVCFEDLSVAEQIALMRRAKMIVTTHGAALANTIFAPAGACVIEIFPRQRKNISLYASLSHALGLEHRVVLGDYTWRKNIRLDLGTLEVALEEALESHPAGQSPEFVA